MDEKYYTVKEIADRFRVSRQAVYDWIREGKLQAVQLGERVRVPESALNAFVRPVQPGEPVGEELGQWAPALVAA